MATTAGRAARRRGAMRRRTPLALVLAGLLLTAAVPRAAGGHDAVADEVAVAEADDIASGVGGDAFAPLPFERVARCPPPPGRGHLR